MTELYYYEKLSMGRWWPRTEPQMPSRRSAEGNKQNIRGIIKVPPDHHHLSLRSLQQIYSIDGLLVATQGREHLAKVQAAAG